MPELLPLFTELPRMALLSNQASDAYDSRNLAQPRSLKNRQFTSCTGALKCVGLVAVAGLVGAVNFALQPGGRKQLRERSFLHGSISRQPAGQETGRS